MPRYIDADKVMEEIIRIGGHNLCEWETIGVKALIDRQPTADVVPKSEYDRMEKLFNDMTQEAKGYLNRLYGIRAEVAREIIDKIESVMFDRFSNIMLGEDIRLCLAELKKKYTEGEKV